MEEVTVRRVLSAPPDVVREAIQDLKPFMKASGFDQVDVDGDFLHVANQVGIATIELTLEIVDLPDADLAYEQREGIFKEMRTTYTVGSTSAGTEISATTQFALDIAIIGEILDSTVIKRQRRKELTAQFDWLEEACSD
jgi:hypothetical protein